MKQFNLDYIILSCTLLSFREIKTGQELEIVFDTTGCHGQPNEVNFLEHVQLQLSMDYTKRGDLGITLTSPSGWFYHNILYKHDTAISRTSLDIFDVSLPHVSFM